MGDNKAPLLFHLDMLTAHVVIFSSHSISFLFLTEDELMLVEAACGAALAAVYSGHIQRLQKEGKLEQLRGPLIMIVCGGSSISLSELQNFKSQLGMV